MKFEIELNAGDERFHSLVEFLNSNNIDYSHPHILQQTHVSRMLYLNVTEDEAFGKSGSKKLMLHFGGGIGYKVLYEDDKGQWIDITDYSTW